MCDHRHERRYLTESEHPPIAGMDRSTDLESHFGEDPQR